MSSEKPTTSALTYESVGILVIIIIVLIFIGIVIYYYIIYQNTVTPTPANSLQQYTVQNAATGKYMVTVPSAGINFVFCNGSSTNPTAAWSVYDTGTVAGMTLFNVASRGFLRYSALASAKVYIGPLSNFELFNQVSLGGGQVFFRSVTYSNLVLAQNPADGSLILVSYPSTGNNPGANSAFTLTAIAS